MLVHSIILIVAPVIDRTFGAHTSEDENERECKCRDVFANLMP